MKSLNSILLTVFVLVQSSPFASAGEADKYVKSLKGKWRGGGILTINSQGKKLKLRCSTNNTLNLGSRTLSMNGRCAMSSGTRSLKGTIRYSKDGARLTTVRLSLAGRSGGDHSSLNGDTLTLRGNFKDDSSNRDIPGRTFIKSDGARLSIQMQSRNSAGWKSNGTLVFKR